MPALARYFALFATVTIGMAQRSNTSPQPMTAESRAWITHTKNGQQYNTESTKFQYIDRLKDNGDGYRSLLLLEKNRTSRTEGEDGITGTVTVTAWPAIRKADQPPLWSFVNHGNDGTVFSDAAMFQITTWPCCSAAFQHVYFSLHTGKRLYVTNGTPEKGSFGQDDGLIRIDHYDKTSYDTERFVAFGAPTRETTDELPTLQYGTDRAIKQRFALRGHTYGDNFDVPHLSVTLDGKELENRLTVDGPISFTIVLHFDPSPYEESLQANAPPAPEYEIRVPVENDIVRADKAILPAGYTFTDLSPISKTRPAK